MRSTCMVHCIPFSLLTFFLNDVYSISRGRGPIPLHWGGCSLQGLNIEVAGAGPDKDALPSGGSIKIPPFFWSEGPALRQKSL